MGPNAAPPQALDLRPDSGDAAVEGASRRRTNVDFTDRHVLVTGGTGALGGAVVAALLAAGAVCHVPCHAGRRPHENSDHPRLRLVPGADLADDVAVMDLFSDLPELWASIHLAGGFAGGGIVETSASELERLFASNFASCFLCCRAAVDAMIKGGRGGRIVNVAARPALEWRAGAHMTAYAASKAAVAALTVALAEEVVRHAILVNAVAPSTIDTPANRLAMPQADASRWVRPEEIARAILFLASPDNTATRGAVVPVYGQS
jgi:NAD(P)-dependent dehydrogenase (short-subunit alcohol dehydrogenase family)